MERAENQKRQFIGPVFFPIPVVPGSFPKPKT
jgi:hypothetical protein